MKIPENMHDLTTLDSYFTILVEVYHKPYFTKKHIYHESYMGYTEHKITVSKPANKCQIIW